MALLFTAVAFTASAQEIIDQNGYNQNSLRPIRNADQMYKMSLWKRIDLKQKQNAPYFSENKYFTGIIIEAVKAGILRPYKDDSLTVRMPLQEFLDGIKRPGAGDTGDDLFGGGDDWGGGGGDDWGGGSGWGGDEGADAGPGSDEIFYKDLHLVELKEDVIFDRKRSRLYHDIQSITIVVPATQTSNSLEKRLAAFSFKELVENVFKDNPQAIWYNDKNTAEHRYFHDALALGLYAFKLEKYSNPKNALIVDVYANEGNKYALGMSEEYRYQMVEYESNLWSN